MDLKPCPFCGEVPKTYHVKELYVKCVNEECNNKLYFKLKEWNHRPIEDGLNFEYFDLLKMYEKDIDKLNR